MQGSASSQNISVSSDSTQTIISGLEPDTNYSIEVRAENAGGVGMYRTLLRATTDPGILHSC